MKNFLFQLQKGKKKKKKKDRDPTISAVTNIHTRFYIQIREYPSTRILAAALEEEPLNHHETPGRQIKQSNQLSLPHQDDCNTKMDIEKRTTKHRTITDSHNGSNNKQKVNNNRTTALERTAASLPISSVVAHLSDNFDRMFQKFPRPVYRAEL